MHKLEMGTFISRGYSFHTAAAPLSEESEHSLVLSLISELNEMFATGLSEDPIVARYLDEDVFEAENVTRPRLILIGSSHLNRIADQLDANKWEVINLSMGGFRPNEDNIAQKTSRVENIKKNGCFENCTVVIQLLDNSVYQVGGPGGTQHLPPADKHGKYHVDRPLLVADKAGVHKLVSQLTPLIKSLGVARKLFLSPLSRYWIRPCCSDDSHHTNFSSSNYLPALGANT
jgi:hypothetical protein